MRLLSDRLRPPDPPRRHAHFPPEASLSVWCCSVVDLDGAAVQQVEEVLGSGPYLVLLVVVA